MGEMGFGSHCVDTLMMVRQLSLRQLCTTTLTRPPQLILLGWAASALGLLHTQ